MFDEEKFKLFQYFVEERYQIFERRKSMKTGPWTRDPILQEYKFCNVHRQNDRVTRWVSENIVVPNAACPLLPFNIVFARVCNWPDTLADIGYLTEWNVGARMWVVDKLQRRLKEGKKTWTSAYMVTGGGIKDPKHVIVGQILDSAYDQLRHGLKVTTLADAGAVFECIRGVGQFLAAQCVADYKEVRLTDAPDYWTWCLPGPGSMRGLSRLTGNALHKVYSEDTFQRYVNAIRKRLNATEYMSWEIFDAQNTQNCLCEFDKYCRVKFNEGTRPKARYVPTASN